MATEENLVEELHSTVTNMYTQVNDELGKRYQPFLNYGYNYPDNSAARPVLDDIDREFLISADLYRYVTSSTALVGKNVVEVGSGRGGGSYYLKKYLGANSVVGLEYLAQSVQIAQKTFSISGLSFIEGDAEQLPFEDASKDVVVNIESSHCYPHIENFFRETCRILKSGAYFCYADLTTPEKRAEIESRLEQLPMTRLKTEDITPRVIESLAKDNARKLALIDSMGLSQARADWWRNEWACVGTQIWDDLHQKKQVYTHWVLRKA